ncbi:TPA: ABC transporter ATP-binding protein [Candidatus Woesearchaeota archaeon]|nr:hypothetical protein [uncultured archaeon]MBS3173738.1 ABC transporter ATP-binding protein [Candidatus Woesearchaeota archaeon]AQS33722.1 hypothetical protein [uncultured archaeon]HIH32282.1 ABC transporter ATP-binding protein [Candidatus Woesearchaeota archaeon]HIH54557.1 ABC transporter ATP-binding protein [Candidatus Woesearchaeota archaeon]
MKFIINHLKNYKGLLILVLVLAVLNQSFSMLDPQIFRIIVDNYATKATTMDQHTFISGVILLLGAFILVALISRIAKTFQDYYLNVITQRIGARMYGEGLAHTFSIPYMIFEDKMSGEILQKLQKARLDTQTFITQLINIVFIALVGILFVVIYSFTVHWSIGITFLLIIPTIGLSIYHFSKSIKAAQKEIVKESANLAGSTTETLRNVELVKSLGLEDQEIKRLNDTNEKILTLELKKVKLVRKLSFMTGTLVNFMRAIIVLLLLYLIFEGNITLGEYFTILIYSFFIFGPLGELGNAAQSYQEARASNQQMDEILNIKSQKNPKNAVILKKLRNIKFQNVSFKYPSGKSHSLNNVNVQIRSGETVAFVGPSGSGKSTLIKLIVGLYTTPKGSILFNDADSRNIDYDNLRKRIGMVSQETQLFAGTIRENLLFVNPDATDKECMNALRNARALSILERSKQGLNTKIGEGGLKISGGERQRISIARALLRKPDILIFDEATSSLDSLTEKEITQTIKKIIKIKKELIVVMIAHRLSTVMHADKIYVLKNGSIIESGSHNYLLKHNGIYNSFWQEQQG